MNPNLSTKQQAFATIGTAVAAKMAASGNPGGQRLLNKFRAQYFSAQPTGTTGGTGSVTGVA